MTKPTAEKKGKEDREPKEHPHLNVIPAKDFFVEMLIRDIALEDAILDLLDNCVDGILRSKANVAGEHPYKGYYAQITFNREGFTLCDNCGGIPWAEREKAFKLGRVIADQRRDDGKPTVGAYGIGMKRALFKIGRHCQVSTKCKNEEPWNVEILPDWFDKQDDWNLPVHQGPNFISHVGTELIVEQLREGVDDQFDKDNAVFTESLKTRIRTQYAYILEKGFKITINGSDKHLQPKTTKLLFKRPKASAESIAAYIYKGSDDGVEIFLTVGFTERPPSGDAAKDADGETNKRSSDDAGWTILCNERAVVYNDKGFLTGWGETPVPQYHTQFIAIAGVVEFRSNDPRKLPTTTTKHGVDASSSLYLHVKNQMRQGMRIFTQYTNRWKNDPEGVKLHFKNAGNPLSFDEIKEMAAKHPALFTSIRRGYPGDKCFSPLLPSPKKETSDKRISFVRTESKITIVGQYLNGGDFKTPSEVGEGCFDYVHDKAQKESED
jgi:hypothetical protein